MENIKNFFNKISNNKVVKWTRLNINLVFLILIPLLLSPLPIAIQEKPAYCGYILIIMCFYWITECIPVGITSLLPVLLFPLFKILSSKCTSQIYFQDIQMLFFGSLAIAIGIEKTGLHERIALIIIMGFGSSPKWLLLGVMFVTGFLSLWIQNTAAASMMLPIVIALVKQLAKYNKSFTEPDKTLPVIKFSKSKNKIQDISVVSEQNLEIPVSELHTGHGYIHHIHPDDLPDNLEGTNIEIKPVLEENPNPKHEETHDLPNTKAARKLMKGFCLSIAYSASIGGSGSLVGTTPNLLLKGYFDDKYPNGGLNFLTYMAFCLPVSIIMVLVAWIVLVFIWLPRSELLFFKNCKTKKLEKGQKDPLQLLIRDRYKQLGPITFDQVSIGILFFLLVLLWLTRELFVIDGWAYFFGSKKFVSDTTPAILIVILAFMWPKKNIFKGHKYEHLLKWSDMDDFPWDVILLGGGSLAMADGFEKSRLSVWVGELMSKILPKKDIWALMIVLIFGEFGTEFTSNTSMASIFIPIADSLANKINILPHYFLLPLTICVSLAFMFPVATQPNTIVFGSGYIKITDMIISGIMIKIVGIFVLLLASNTWLYPIFGSFKDQTFLNLMNSTVTALPRVIAKSNDCGNGC